MLLINDETRINQSMIETEHLHRLLNAVNEFTFKPFFIELMYKKSLRVYL